MKKQKYIATVINLLCIFAVIFLNKHRLATLVFICLIMLLNFWNLMDLKKKCK